MSKLGCFCSSKSHQHPVTCARSVTIIDVTAVKEHVVVVVVDDVVDDGDADDESCLSL